MAIKKATKKTKVKKEEVVEEVKTPEIEVTPPDVKEAGSEPEEEARLEADATTTPKEEEEDLPEEKVEAEIKKVEKEMNVIGHVRSRVFQKSSFIKTKSLRAPVCLSVLPPDLRRYLINKGWGPNVYEKGEERLLKHNADMNMIEKLKKFLSDNYL